MDSAWEWLEALCADRADGESAPRCVMVWSHPDDEAVGASYLVSRVAHATYIYVTDGSPRTGEDARAAGFATAAGYARARLLEAKRALSLSPIPREAVYFFNVPDQQCTEEISSITRDLVKLFREIQPAVVLTHPYEGGHPDHDSTALAVHAACAILQRDDHFAPVILEATSYHNANGGFAFGKFLSHESSVEAEIHLDETDQDLKKRLIECYETQRHLLRSVILDTERYRVAPAYDFSQPPHPGTLLYELFSWNITGPRWRRLARAALQELGVEHTVLGVANAHV